MAEVLRYPWRLVAAGLHAKVTGGTSREPSSNPVSTFPGQSSRLAVAGPTLWVGVLSAYEYARLLHESVSAEKPRLLYHSRRSGVYLVQTDESALSKSSFRSIASRRWFLDYAVSLQAIQHLDREPERDPREGLQWYADDWGTSLGRRFPLGVDQRHPILQLDRIRHLLNLGAISGLASSLSQKACERHVPLTSRTWAMQQLLDNGIQELRETMPRGVDPVKSEVDILLHDSLPDTEHPELSQVVVGSEVGAPARPMGVPHWHGTHAAGVLAALRNRSGIAGVVPGNRVVAFGLRSTEEPHGGATFSDVIMGLGQVKTYLDKSAVTRPHDLHVLLLGYGAEVPSLEEAEPLRIVLDDISTEHNVLVVAPAGNLNFPRKSSQSAFVPADLAPSINNTRGRGFLLPVAASDVCSRAAWFSHVADAGDGKAYFAPGYEIYATLPRGDFGYRSGTSSAAAVVAGMSAALGQAMASITRVSPPSARGVAELMQETSRPMSFRHSFFIFDGQAAAEHLIREREGISGPRELGPSQSSGSPFLREAQ